MPFIFITGNSRSGTTMMGRILNNHEWVHTLPELHFFEQLWSSADKNKILDEGAAVKLSARLLNISVEGYFAVIQFGKYDEEAKQIVTEISEDKRTALQVYASTILHEAKKFGKQIPCDKTPQNVFYINDILEAFPDARIINMIRDPRDVLLSQKRKWKRRFLGGAHATWFETVRAWTNYHPITISKLWNAAMRAGLFLTDDRIMQIQFEKLLREPAQMIPDICEFAKIPFSNQLQEVPHMGSSSGVDHPEVKGINATRAQSWNNGGLNKTEIWFCQRTCKDLMKKLNYEPASISPNPFFVIWYYFIFPVKLGFAFMLNIHRMKNIGETIRKRLK
jgi:hypothetical protein